jgi:hypothetical protein
MMTPVVRKRVATSSSSCGQRCLSSSRCRVIQLCVFSDCSFMVEWEEIWCVCQSGTSLGFIVITTNPSNYADWASLCHSSLVSLFPPYFFVIIFGYKQTIWGASAVCSVVFVTFDLLCHTLSHTPSHTLCHTLSHSLCHTLSATPFWGTIRRYGEHLLSVLLSLSPLVYSQRPYLNDPVQTFLLFLVHWKYIR